MTSAGPGELTSASERPTATRRTYAGLFLVTLATLAYQISLTRIFSVTLWYHYAFLAVSLAMLGMTIGAIAVYLLPDRFQPGRVHRHLASSSFVFALAIVASLLVHLAVPVRTDPSFLSILTILFTCTVIAVPFTASGVCVALALTRFPRQVSGLYAADLAGAGIGCLLLVLLLSVTDGPTSVFVIALVANLATLCFAAERSSRALFRLACASALLLGAFSVGHTFLARAQSPLVRITWMRDAQGLPRAEPPPRYERWNSHSRIRVAGFPNRTYKPFGWSFSPTLPAHYRVRQLFLSIDSGALTVLTGFDGSLDELDYLKFDITNLAHHLRRDADVLVIGAGGGRDVLSALTFGQSSVVAVEVNANILDVTNRVYGDFTGHLDRFPGVTFVNDEARSYTARSPDRFDIIQISLIDSWAATAAGAFVLTEHSLYTVEAWKIFLEHLKPNGILTVTRYYFPEHPGTAYRLVSLAVAALQELGVERPRHHIAMARLVPRTADQVTMSTILVSPQPFSGADLEALEVVTERLEFRTTLSPRQAEDETFSRIAAGGDLSSLYAELPFDVSPTTDDSPFFFHMLRFRDILRTELSDGQGIVSFNLRAVFILGWLLLALAALTLLFVIVPLVIRSPLGGVGDLAPWFLVFAGIGTGFMMIEISQMERLIVFLGHPVYALSVVLFTLLLSSGLGSLSTQRVMGSSPAKGAGVRLAGSCWRCSSPSDCSRRGSRSSCRAPRRRFGSWCPWACSSRSDS